MAHEYDIDFDEIVHVDWARDGETHCPALTDASIEAPIPSRPSPILSDGFPPENSGSFFLPSRHMSSPVVSTVSPHEHGTKAERPPPNATPGTFPFENTFRTSGCGVILADDLPHSRPGLTKEMIRKFVAAITGNTHQLVPYNVLKQLKREGVPRSCSSFVFLFLFNNLEAFEGEAWDRITKSLGQDGLDGKILPLFEGGLLPGGSPLLEDVAALRCLHPSTPVIHNIHTGRIFTPSELVALATPLRPRSPLLLTRPEREAIGKKPTNQSVRSTCPTVPSALTKCRARLGAVLHHNLFTIASISTLWNAVKKRGIWDAPVSTSKKSQKKQPLVAGKQLERIAMWEITAATLSLFLLGFLLCTAGSLLGTAVSNFGNVHKQTVNNNATADKATATITPTKIPTTIYTSTVYSTQTTLATVTKTQWELATKITETTSEPKPVVHIDGNGRPVTEIAPRHRANPSVQLGRMVSVGLGRALGKTPTITSSKETYASRVSKKKDKPRSAITAEPTMATYIAVPPFEERAERRPNSTALLPFPIFDYTSFALKVLQKANETAAIVMRRSNVISSEVLNQLKCGALAARQQYESAILRLHAYFLEAKDWIFGIGAAGQGRRWAQGSTNEHVETAAKKLNNISGRDGELKSEKTAASGSYNMRWVPKLGFDRLATPAHVREKWEQLKKRASEIGQKGQAYTGNMWAGDWMWVW